MSGADEEWVRAAMSDDAMVVELLVRLHHAPPLLKRGPLPLEWSFRRRRSKSASANNNLKKPAHGHRGSPTTPLSWSNAASLSGGSTGAGGCGGSEECSRPTPLKLSGTSGSKVTIDGEKTNSKRPRKKKTLAELKSEEHLLVKERRELQREMATLSLYLERQRATNANLKKMKVELRPHRDEETKSANASEESISGRLRMEVAASRHIPPAMPAAVKKEAKPDVKFVLPDLNVPFL